MGYTGKEQEMTVQEASERYNIPVKILKEYESWGLCDAVKNVMGVWQYDEEDIKRLSMIMTLHDIGFGTLDEIHFKERQLDWLDYLRYEIRKAAQK